MKQIRNKRHDNVTTWTRVAPPDSHFLDDDAVAWCCDNGSDDKFFYCFGYFLFENPVDALAFKIKWSDGIR